MFNRTKIKYGERGYRYILLDAGYIGENIYLVSNAMGLGVVSIGGFIDDDINELLDINGVDEAVIYIFAIGKIS
jgi:SagB-type dehydrogenase family enzyme